MDVLSHIIISASSQNIVQAVHVHKCCLIYLLIGHLSVSNTTCYRLLMCFRKTNRMHENRTYKTLREHKTIYVGMSVIRHLQTISEQKLGYAHQNVHVIMHNICI